MTIISVYQDEQLVAPSLPCCSPPRRAPPSTTKKNKTDKDKMRSSSLQQQGRTPLGKRTNGITAATATTPGTTSTLQNFRRSLLSPNVVQQSTRAAGTVVPDKKQATTDRVLLDKENPPRTDKKSVTFSQNHAASRTTALVEVAPPSSLQKTLRATLSPGLQRARARGTPRFKNAAAVVCTKVSTTKTTTIPPQTPNSMLKEEIDLVDNANDASMLLLSPAPQRLKSRTTVADVAVTNQQDMASLPKIVPKAAESKRFAKEPKADTTAKEARAPTTALINSTARSTWSRVMPAVVAGPPPTTARSNRTSSSSAASTVDTAAAVIAAPAVASTPAPFTSRGNGVCMDLSDIFFDAASTQRRTSKPPALATAQKKKKQPALYSSSLKSKSRKSAAAMKSPFVTRSNATAVSMSKTATKAAAVVAVDQEDWAEKQCETFTNWLNYTLHPTEDAGHHDEQHGSAAPAQEQHGLKMLILHQRQAAARTKALQIYQSTRMIHVRKTMLSEIGRGRLAIRNDRDMYSDLTLRNQIVQLLFSYSVPWLRLGLETLFGVSIAAAVQTTTSSLQSAAKATPSRLASGPAAAVRLRKVEKTPVDPMKLAIKQFIIQRVLSDDATLAKYTKGRCKVPSGNFEKKYRAEMRLLVLNRLLVLFFFLDHARKAHVLEKTPRLFVKTAKVKSTRQVLLEFCRLFLKAEGDLIKHLSRVGLKVCYQQTPVDELDFTITNLAVDLRDGVRLARITEILTGAPPKSVLSSLRLPAVSRLQKLHNVGLVLTTLRDFGVPLSTDIVSHHIVDGHREMVLKLMWATVAHCCLKELLDVEKVESEIDRIRHSSASKRHAMPMPSTAVEASGGSLEDREEADLKSLLLRWSQAVCSCFGVQVNDLTNDFADGKASCLLIHYYHPNVLHIDEIHSTSSDLPANRPLKQGALESTLANERANAVLANNRISELGGIPKMIPVCDTSSVPEEKSMLLCLSFMCSRLMESGAEIRSCVLIQQRYRKYRESILSQKKRVAAVVIIAAWRENKATYFLAQRKKYGGAVLVLQRFIISNRDQLKSLERHRLARQRIDEAATMIQKHVRGHVAKIHFGSLFQLQRSLRVLQCRWRFKTAARLVRQHAVQQSSATTIQQCWRGFQLHSYHSHVAATKIQAIWRGFWVQLQYQIDLMDVITVQCCARMRLAEKEHNRRSKSVGVIQRTIRRHLLKKEEKHQDVQRACVSAVVKFQSCARRYLAIKTQQDQLQAALCIQRSLRMSLAQTRSQRQRLRVRAAVVLQSIVRTLLTRLLLHRRSEAALCVQSTWRMLSARLHVQSIRRQERAAGRLQSAWRIHTANVYSRELRLCHQAATRLQSAYRTHLAKGSLCDRQAHLRAVVRLQSVFRMHLSKTVVSMRRLHVQGATLIQSACRMYLAKSQWLKMQLACIQLQAHGRRIFARRRFVLVSNSAAKVQACWRAKLVRTKYAIALYKIVTVQSCLRRKAATLQAARRRSATSIIQRSIRRTLVLQHVSATRRVLHEQHDAACVIQREWRCFCTFVKFRLVVSDVIVMQTAFRRALAMTVCRQRLEAVFAVQRSCRCWFARRHLAELSARRDEKANVEKRASLVIQSLFRGHLIRREIVALTRFATVIQQLFRGYFSRINYRMDLIDVIISQSAVRRWKARRVLSLRRESVVRLQTTLRMHLAKQRSGALRSLKRKTLRENSSALSIQTAFRGCVARCTVSQGLAARRIQKTWRCYTVHVDFMLSMLASISIQTCVRRHLCMQAYRKKSEASYCLQGFARQALKHMKARKVERSATILQSFSRMLITRSNFRLQRTAALLVQRLVRGFLGRLEVSVQSFAACEIQRIWRGYDAYVNFAWSVLSVIKLQSVVRMRFARVQLQTRRSDKLAAQILETRSARLLQRCFRVHLQWLRRDRALRILQRSFKVYLSKTTFAKLRRGTIKVQSLVRGHQTRSMRPKKVEVQVLRLERANTRAQADPKLRLGNRTRVALDILQKSTRLAEIMTAICTLEIATRLSKVCCDSFAEANAPDILFSLIRTCNRSLPHVELLHHILLTMSNVSQYDDLMPCMGTVTGVEVFLDLVQMFRDKDGVFCLAVSLLERVVQCSEDYQDLCSSRENLKRLKGVHALCVRKLSISHAGRVSMGRESIARASKVNVNTIRMTRRDTDLRQGVRTLQRIINLVD